jgi:DNA-binding transcriptional LysR family regulator
MEHIHKMNLSKIDLNLLVVLDALLSEQNVTRAAARIGPSQPAMSSALGRLRNMFDDQLLSRAPSGMIPTERATSLAGPVRQILREVEAALGPVAEFKPNVSRRTFKIATVDYAEFVLLPALLRELTKTAPLVDIEMWPLSDNYPEEALRSGQLDLAIGFSHRIPQRLRKQMLFEDRFVCAVRSGHPSVRQRLTLSQHIALPHVLISQRGSVIGVVDHALEIKGMKRRVAVTVPHFLIAPIVVSKSDYIVTLAERVAATFAELLPLRLLKPPIKLPRLGVAMVWHERTEHDPAQQWLRKTLLAIGQQRARRK